MKRTGIIFFSLLAILIALAIVPAASALSADENDGAVLASTAADADVTVPVVSLSSTNDVADKQTVSIMLSDNAGLKGFYWGKESVYTQNKFYAASGTSKRFTVSIISPATFYATAVDHAGNVSATKSITFYKTSLNANGGSAAPDAVITMKGNSFTFPEPTEEKEGYTYAGWSTSSTAASGVKSLAPTKSETYYIAWKPVAAADTTAPTVTVTATAGAKTSQKVTILLTDNVALKGYYWSRTKDYYSDSDFHAASGTEAELYATFSNAYTYYFTAVDAAGNRSVTKEITSYKTVLNDNGGSVDPDYIITIKGYSFTFPTPTANKAGYTYAGWSTSSTAASGVKSLTPTKNETYYIAWKPVAAADTTKPTVTVESATNNIATEQVVSFLLEDNVGLQKVYWGQNADYLNNEVYTISGKTKSFTATFKSGYTYYVTAVDTSGNVSATKAVTSYKTTLNANGGSVDPDYIVTIKGNSFTFPAPTVNKTGYTYAGWSTSSTAASGVKSLTPTKSETYYIAWNPVAAADTTKPTAAVASVTNNTASTQTVTIRLTDNAGLKYYYWGTSSDYTKNSRYTASGTSGSYTRTVSASGTYYVVAVDASGNVSARSSVTFYLTTLKPNGGAVKLSSVLTKSGNSFTLPTPTVNKTGCTYAGWSTSSTAASGVKTLKPTANSTYYVVWQDSTKPTVSLTSTNSVASTQTVTIRLTDNAGLKYYYWGTSSDYTKNSKYTASGTSGSYTRTVSASGTYYVVAVDATGNVSARSSVTFYLTTLKPNGGTVKLSSVLTKSGNSFTFPTPTRSGYTYVGWAKAKDDATGIKTLKPAKSETYYAVWRPTSSYNVHAGTLTYSFGNHQDAFGYSSTYYIPLTSYQIIFGKTTAADKLYKSSTPWIGNCFGMAATSSLFNVSGSGATKTSYRSGAASLMDLKVTDSNGTYTLKRFIEAMQVSQLSLKISQEREKTKNNLSGLCSAVRNVPSTGKPVIIGIYGVDENGKKAGHQLVGYYLEKYSSSIWYIQVYDCNFPNKFRRLTVYVNSSGTPYKWYYHLNDALNWGSAYTNGYINYNNYSTIQSVWSGRGSIQADYNMITSSSDSFTVYNADGALVAQVADGELIRSTGGVIPVNPTGFTTDGTASSGVMLYLPVDSYRIVNTAVEDEIEISMMNLDRAATITTTADEILFTVDDASAVNQAIVYADGTEEYEVVMTSSDPDEAYQNITVSGVTSDDETTVTCTDGEITVSGSEDEASDDTADSDSASFDGNEIIVCATDRPRDPTAPINRNTFCK